MSCGCLPDDVEDFLRDAGPAIQRGRVYTRARPCTPCCAAALIIKGNIAVVNIFPNLPDLAETKIFLNEFLDKKVLNLLRLVRARAKTRNYERVWVRNEQIFVRKNTDSEVISISSESDLNKLI